MRTPGHLVRRLHQISSALFAQEVAAVGITPVQYAALVVIAGAVEPDATTVALAVACDRATIGGVVDRLEAKGLVRRRPSKRDRRIKSLAITSTGAICIDSVERSVARVQTRLLAPLNPSERATFSGLLARLVAAHAVEPPAAS